MPQIEIMEKRSSNILLSLSFIPITDRVLGPYYKLRTDFYHADVWPRAKCVGHTRSVHDYQRSLSRNKPNAVFFLISGNLLSIPDEVIRPFQINFEAVDLSIVDRGKERRDFLLGDYNIHAILAQVIC